MAEAGGSTDLVTFLFTDLESSTRLWEQHPQAMQRALEQHDRILRDAIESTNGRVVKTTGDGTHGVFDDAADALRAALEAQRALAQEPWPDTGPLRVRMGLHTCTAQLRDGDYYGPEVNRAARLMSAAWGGQLLCSRATTEMLRDRVVDVTLRDLGEHRLADLTDPERIYQAVHPDLPIEFPPIRSAGAYRHNLPAAVTPFVGRRVELQEVERLLSRSRLVTITGAGGVGKTRVAVEAATTTLDRYPDGVWMAELATVRDGMLVPFTAAASLRMNTSGVETAEAMTANVCAHLTTKQTLLVLDNCEHLIDSAAQFTDAVLARCPDVAVLTTSRETLGLRGESVWRVPPLSLPDREAHTEAELLESDAVSLFCERAREAEPGFTLGPDYAADVVTICRRLDGIPLALELAAARIRALGVHEVAGRLADSFRVLTGGTRTSVSRHETLRATLDWSYELLAPSEQAVLRRLAIFRGGFALDAAEAVAAGIDADTIEQVARLVDKSLVVADHVDGKVRYRLLEPVRQYAHGLLVDAGEEAETRALHGRFLAARTRDMQTVLVDPVGMARVYEDEPNLRAALEWAFECGDADAMLALVGTLWLPWFFMGTPDTREWLEQILDATRGSASVSRAVALGGLVTVLRPSGTTERARLDALLAEARGVVGRTDDPVAAGWLDFVGAETEMAFGNGGEARRLLGNALTMARSLGDDASAALCLDHLGWVAVQEGDYEGARGAFEEAADLARQQGAWEIAVGAMSALAPLLAPSDPGAAKHFAQDALSAAEHSPARALQVLALAGGAETGILTEDDELAHDRLTRLLIAIREIGTQRWLGDALELTAMLHELRSDHERAVVMFGACAALRETAGTNDTARVIGPAARAARARAEARLGPEQFDACHNRGRSLTPEQALDEAIAALATK